MEECNQFGQCFLLKADIKELQNEIDSGNTASFSRAQKFIRQQADLAMIFLKNNNDIIIAQADKGGKVIIMDRILYELKVDEHLKENLENHTYYHWKEGSIESCRKILEPKFTGLRMSLNQYLRKDLQDWSIEPEPYVIAKLYVLVKSHKDGIRPIIAAPDSWGGRLSNWILNKLELISNLFDQVKVINSEEFVAKIKEIGVIPESHKLTNWDYVSMFILRNGSLGRTTKSFRKFRMFQ